MANFDYFDDLENAIENAPEAGFGPNSNFGKCTMVVEVSSWNNDEKKFEKRPFKKGEKLGQGENLQLNFEVDIMELNDALTFNYKKFITVKHSRKNAKGEVAYATDWDAIVQPSLLKVFGKDWSKKLAKGVYVEVQDVETVETDKDGNPKGRTSQTNGNFYVNTAPSFVRAFANKAECQKAREEKYTKKDSSIELGNDSVPTEILGQIKGLQAAKLPYAQIVELVTENPPYNQYVSDELPAEELLKQAGVLPF